MGKRRIQMADSEKSSDQAMKAAALARTWAHAACWPTSTEAMLFPC